MAERQQGTELRDKGTVLCLVLAVVGVTGIASGVVGTGISTDWTADPIEYAAAGMVSGMMNILSFGLAPINGEIVKGSIGFIVKQLIVEGTKDIAINAVMRAIVTAGTILITDKITYSDTTHKSASNKQCFAPEWR